MKIPGWHFAQRSLVDGMLRCAFTKAPRAAERGLFVDVLDCYFMIVKDVSTMAKRAKGNPTICDQAQRPQLHVYRILTSDRVRNP